MSMKQVQILEATKTGTNNVGRRSTGIQVERTRVAAYCRVSTDGDEQLGSFASQKAYYEEKSVKTESGYRQVFLLMKQLPEQRWTSGKDFRT